MVFSSRVPLALVMVAFGFGSLPAGFAADAASDSAPLPTMPAQSSFTPVAGAPHVQFDDSSFPSTIVNEARFKASARGADIRKLTIHLRGPLNMPADKDRHVRNVLSSSGATSLTFNEVIDLTDIPPGNISIMRMLIMVPNSVAVPKIEV